MIRLKRAGLLQDIVKTISVIPDAIVRGEYIKECSALMNVTEQVLYNEIGKLTRKKREESYKNNRPSIQVPTSTPPPEVANPAFAIQNPFEVEEKELIRFLIKFGDKNLVNEGEEVEEDHITVGEYILTQLKEDELESNNELYNKIFKLYEENKDKEGFEAIKFFVSNMDTEVSKLASDLLSREFTLSKIHQRFGSGDLDEGTMLAKLVPKLINELKLKKVKILIEQKRKELKEAEIQSDEVKFMEIMQVMVRLQQFQTLISKELGNRTII